MERMKESERLYALLATLLFVVLMVLLSRHDDTNTRMAEQGFMPLRLSGDSKVYWLPIPSVTTSKRQHELDDFLKQ